MSTHNIGFDDEISKVIPLLSSNTHLIYFFENGNLQNSSAEYSLRK